MILSRREYVIKEEDRQFLDFIPPASILLGGIIFIVGTILAIFLYETPNNGYQFLDQFFSELGIRANYMETDGMRYAPKYPEIFNTTLYASGFLMVPFFMFTHRQMRNANRVSNFYLIVAVLSGIIAGPMLIGVGIFDLSYPANTFWQEHAFWVGGLYLLITITSICWYIMLLTSSKLPYRKTKWIWLDYLFLVLLTLFTIINISDGAGVLYASDIPLINTYPIETYQKLIAYLFFAYYGLVVGVRLTKTKYDNTPRLTTQPTIVIARPKMESSRDGKLFCVGCGTENPPGEGYCTHCGTKLT